MKVKVKEVRVDAIHFVVFGGGRYKIESGWYWDCKTFKTLVDENGNVIRYIDNREVTKDEGNAEYLKIYESNKTYRTTKACREYLKRTKERAEDTFKQTVTEYETTYEEIIEGLKKSIDEYVEYIDDGGQYEEAVAHNKEIEAEIAKYRKLMEEGK